ncbi:hypothetical protein L1887_53542 [Cichorium endivia]|nr:hypothetical protein L1887_53542 [Cichorium endivia]
MEARERSSVSSGRLSCGCRVADRTPPALLCTAAPQLVRHEVRAGPTDYEIQTLSSASCSTRVRGRSAALRHWTEKWSSLLFYSMSLRHIDLFAPNFSREVRSMAADHTKSTDTILDFHSGTGVVTTQLRCLWQLTSHTTIPLQITRTNPHRDRAHCRVDEID